VRRSPYRNLYERIVANTHEPQNAQDCWLWARRLGNGGYGRINIHVPMVGGNVTLMVHIALWVWFNTSPRSIDEFYLFYLEFVNSGLELDHACVMPPCCNLDHLEPLTPSENNIRKYQRRRLAGA